MITTGAFNASIDDSVGLLKKMRLFKGTGPKPKGAYSPMFFTACRTNNHSNIYNAIRDNLDYEIVLQDDSFFQFCRSDKYLRYSFVEAPNMSLSKKDYIDLVLNDDSNSDDLSEEEINEFIDENEYEQFLNEQESNSNLIYLRYDYDLKGYNPLLHSCSHMHVGLREDFRIPLSIALTPIQFVIFSLKQAYHNSWVDFHRSFPDEIALQSYLNLRKNQCAILVEANGWKLIEKNELYIS